VTRLPSAKLRAYLLITAVGSIAALAVGRPQLVALAVPFAAYVVVGLALATEPSVSLSGELGRERMLEGEQVAVTVLVAPRTDVHLLELELRPRGGLVAVGERRRALRLRAGGRQDARFTMRADRWGGYPAGAVSCRARDRFGLIEYDLPAVALAPLRVFPRFETLRTLLHPVELQPTTGNRVSPTPGEGIEFADVRPFAPGDRVRRINWLAAYLASRDRVGVIGFGGVLHGFRPGLGTAQLYWILDALIGSEVVFSYAQKDVDFVPRRLLPPKALVIAITPLIDERSIRALFGLRARGFDLALLDVSPVALAPPGPSASDALAHRLWILQRNALKARFERFGVAVSEWSGEEPLQIPLASGTGFRRRARQTVAA
jgi:uncharacterized protein (DUF58 family)